MRAPVRYLPPLKEREALKRRASSLGRSTLTKARLAKRTRRRERMDEGAKLHITAGLLAIGRADRNRRTLELPTSFGWRGRSLFSGRRSGFNRCDIDTKFRQRIEDSKHCVDRKIRLLRNLLGEFSSAFIFSSHLPASTFKSPRGGYPLSVSTLRPELLSWGRSPLYESIGGCVTLRLGCRDSNVAA